MLVEAGMFSGAEPPPSEEETPIQEKCGIACIHSKRPQDMRYLALQMGKSLEHRGPQSTGIGIASPGRMHVIGGFGPLLEGLDSPLLQQIDGEVDAIGIHTRWATEGGNTRQNIQPILCKTPEGETFQMYVNGNTPGFRELLDGIGYMLPEDISDTVVLAHALATAPRSTLEEKMQWLLDQNVVKNSAYCMVVIAGDMAANIRVLYARDQFELHPLSIGKLGDDMIILASETCAFDEIGAKPLRQVRRGEFGRIDKNGITVLNKGLEYAGEGTARCLFERVYFMRPDSLEESGDDPNTWPRIAVGRYRIGQMMAKAYLSQLNIDNITAVPDSGNFFAQGVANASGGECTSVIIKKRPIRTFTMNAGDQETMDEIDKKFAFIGPMIRGRRLLIVDDTLVKGNTTRRITQKLRDLGALEVHWFFGLSEIIDDCHLGANLKGGKNMLARIHNRDWAAIAQGIGADSIRFPTYEMVVRALHDESRGEIVTPNEQKFIFLANGWCGGCITGEHPADMQGNRNIYYAGGSTSGSLVIPSD
ncbi:MAG: hypothetical protein N2691_04745 [Patescibacteria group bacterium]|nr:hypothetical protein [Patescibacteria group bacterium]